MDVALCEGCRITFSKNYTHCSRNTSRCIPAQPLCTYTAAPMFTDESFEAAPSSLGHVGAAARWPVAWARLGDLFPEASLFSPSLGYEDVAQGAIGDCFYVTALALISTRGKDLQSIVRHGKEPGKFIVRYMACGEWAEEVVDDFIPVSVRDSGARKPLFAYSKSHRQLCFSLVEKAMAKRYGSYAALMGGNTSEALYELTGCPVEDHNLSKIGREDAWELLRRACGDERLVSVGHIDTSVLGQEGADGATLGPLGIRKNHAYAVIEVTHEHMKVYNPGANDAFEGETNAKGTHVVPRKEFLRRWKQHPSGVFNRAQVCKLTTGGRMTFYRVFGGLRWDASQGTAGGSTNFPATFHTNPALCLAFPKPCTIDIVAGQPDQRSAFKGAGNAIVDGASAEDSKLDYPQIGLTVLRLKDGASLPMLTPDRYDVVAKSSAFWNKREVAVSFKADSNQEGPFIVVPSTYSSGVSGDFWVSVAADAPPAKASWHTLAKDFHQATWRGPTDSNRVRLHCRLDMPGARVVVFVHQEQKELHPIGVHVQSRVPPPADRGEGNAMSDGKDDGLILLRTKSFVKGVFTSFSVTLPEDANSCVIVPCTMKAKQQQALLSVTVCVLQQCSSGADAVCNGVSSSPALAPCVSLKASKASQPIGEELNRTKGDAAELSGGKGCGKGKPAGLRGNKSLIAGGGATGKKSNNNRGREAPSQSNLAGAQNALLSVANEYGSLM